MAPKMQRIFPALYLLAVLSLLRCPSVLCGCDHPPDVAHGSYKNVGSRSFKNKVQYQCDSGYTMYGAATLTCSSSRWLPEAPKCKALCQKPEIEHGKPSVEKQQYIESETVTIQCDSGYGVVGHQNITCSEDRTWFPEVPKCEWEFPEGCERVQAGRSIMQCLPNAADAKMALEVYKLSLEIELLELQRDEERKLN